MAKMFVGDVFEALDEERIALRVKVAMLRDQWGSRAEFQLAAERLSELDDQLRAIIAERRCKVGQRTSGRNKTQRTL